MRSMKKDQYTLKWERDVRRSIKRLEASDTQLKRRRARMNLWRVLAEIKRDCIEMYPPLLSTGLEVKQPRNAPPCPFCGIPARGWKELVFHMRNHEDDARRDGCCWCGKEVEAFDGRGDGLERHLRGVHVHGKTDLKTHIAAGILMQSAMGVRK